MKTTSKLVSIDRVIELLDCYGANTQNWPEDERAAAKTLIKQSDELQQYQEKTQRMDKLMGIGPNHNSLSQRADAHVVANIINNLPKQAHISSALPHENKLLKSANSWLKLGIAATFAAIFFASFVTVTQLTSTESITVATATQNDLDQWIWQEVTDQPIEDNDDTLTFMAMLDLESLPDNDY